MKGKFFAAIVGGAALLALPPGTAFGLTTHEVTTTTVTDNLMTATANCDPGEKVVSGGFETDFENYVQASRAQGDGAWTATVFQSGGTASLTVSANCTDGPGVSGHSVKKRISDNGERQGSVKVNCGSNKSMVAGGYETVNVESGVHDLTAFKSRATGAKWQISAVNGAGDAHLKAFAYCRQGGEVKERSDSAPIAADAEDTATATCHQGEELLSGGYSTSPKTDYNNATGPDFFYNQSFRSGNRAWTASAHNYSNVGGTLTALAYCKA